MRKNSQSAKLAPISTMLPSPPDAVRISISSDVDIVKARQAGRRVAEDVGFVFTELALIATAISELARNIVRYARSGEIADSTHYEPGAEGHSDRCSGLRAGNPRCRTGTANWLFYCRGAGTGPSGSATFDGRVRYSVQSGARHNCLHHEMEGLRENVLDCGVAARPLRGERASGDKHLIQPFREGMLIAVVDGLGHGLEAAEAAKTVVTTLKQHAGESVLSLVNRCQASLAGTRGVAVSIASFNITDSTMTWLGIGNVEGVLVRSQNETAAAKEFLLLARGFIGGHISDLRAFVVPVEAGDTLTFATDGVASDFHEEVNVVQSPQKIADRVLSVHGKDSDDALVVVARFVGSPK